MMRWLLVEAGQTAARLDPELRRMYQRLKNRRAARVAKVAIARRLAVRLYWMLRTRRTTRSWFACPVARVAQWFRRREAIEGLIGRRASLHEAGRSNDESWSPDRIDGWWNLGSIAGFNEASLGRDEPKESTEDEAWKKHQRFVPLQDGRAGRGVKGLR